MAKKRLKVRGPALAVPDLHRLRIARQTLRMTDVGARIMGGMTKDEARQVIFELTGKRVRENPASDLKRYRVKVVATVFARSPEEAEHALLRAIETGRQQFALPTAVRDFAPAAEVWEIDGQGHRHGGITLHE